MNASQPTVSFKTVGCRLNQAETEKMADQFSRAGYRLVQTDEPCDIAVINTCTITHSAERDCARLARRLRRKGARIVILAGCAVEYNGTELQQRTGADIIVGQNLKFKLPQILAKDFGINPQTNPLPVELKANRTRALIKAQDGCAFRCSYCVVPDTRGLPTSLPLQTVLDDIRQHADQGCREIVITGANLGCYNDNGNNLIKLLSEAEKISGIERIRIGSIESTTAERQVIDYMADSAKLCHFLHLPLQSGDDTILKKMRRHYTAAQYRSLIEYAIERVPDLGLGTDIIVGFPGETAAAFQNSFNLINELPFSNLHVFSYSIRSGTPAADMPHQIDAAVKKERSARLIELGHKKRADFARSFIGRQVSLLIERITPDSAAGWTQQYLPARISNPTAKENDIITFTPTTTKNDTLLG